MYNEKLKQKLKNNELTIGSWITIGHSSIVEIMAPLGFDWLTIDIEHTSIDYSTLQSMIQSIQFYDLPALVRVSKNDEVIIKRVMDMGADGIIVPSINSKEDAEKAVNFTKYPPTGKRGVGLSRAQKYGQGFDEYKEWLEKNAVIIAQVEHYSAVENIEEIITTAGIDGIIIGPYDLSASMGLPGEYDNPIVKEKIIHVEEVCKVRNFPLGFHVIDPNIYKFNEKISSGYKFLAFSTDFLFLSNKIKSELNLLLK